MSIKLNNMKCTMNHTAEFNLLKNIIANLLNFSINLHFIHE